MLEVITSTQNPKIKNIHHLEKAGERKEKQEFIIEGFREIQLAYQNQYQFQYVLYCPTVSSHPNIVEFISNLTKKIAVYEISQAIFQKITYRENSDGLVAVAKTKYHTLSDIRLSQNPFIIVMENVEKPGNLGAILRTADAAHIDAILVCNPQTDIFNPNVIRSSIGCVFTQQVVCCTSSDAYQWLQKNQIKIYASALTATSYYHQVSFHGPSAIIMGTEAHGLSNFWLENSTQLIKINMRGTIDSLNVSTATAILTYEAMRQRNFL